MQTDASEERLSKYELLRLLGAGGMGEVYLARDTVLQRQVAIKFVSPSQLGDRGANARLLREARAAATLDHPGICPIYDVQVDASGRTCIVMQYVEGETLAARLARGAIDPAEARELAAAIADALAAAHAHGIVHRDLKPQNVMLMPDGRPKLLDFGIAESSVPADAAAEVVTRTATSAWAPGAIVGTPAYTSPEQVLRKPIDARSDLFSLGTVLFECLTGQAAFQAASDIETWARVVYAISPPPSSIDPRVPASLDAIVARLLAKEPEQRYASAQDAASALRRGEGGVAGPVEAPRQNRVRPALAAVAAVAAIAFAGYGGWRALHPRPAPPPAAAQEYYDRGLQYLRDGAYARAEKVLAAAVGIHPPFPAALARLAEARNELDEEASAQDAIVRIGDMTRGGLVLPKADAIRVDAISALLENDLSRAEAGYRTLADAGPRDRGAWLDLARVRQEAGLRVEAEQAARRALQVSPNDAAAHLRLASLAADAVHRDDAIREFKEAERLYALDSLTEGQAEALLQQAIFLDTIGAFDESRRALDAADRYLTLAESPYQQARATMLRSSLAGSKGDIALARRLADSAVATAQAAGLNTIAADALIQVGLTSTQLGEYEAARSDLEHGVDLAKRSGAKRVALRGTLQLASVYLQLHQPQDAENLATGMLDFARRGQYRRYEMIASNIIARSLEHRDPRRSVEMAKRVLAAADSLHDNVEVGAALEVLAGPMTGLGDLPGALAVRTRLEALHRAQHDTGLLPYDLTNRAELLIELGRFDEAETALRELDAGVAAGSPLFRGRARRAALLRTLAAAERLDRDGVLFHAQSIIDGTVNLKAPDASHFFALALAAPFRRPVDTVALAPTAGNVDAELRYWRAVAFLSMHATRAAAAEIDDGLAQLIKVPSQELEWRLAAVGASAAREGGDASKADAMRTRAQGALNAVRAAWKSDVEAYEGRPDLTRWRRAAGVS
jgi:tRNA A-37 threonylcarbamoyl transferase component Bud32/tetratricopeptide (TPR) repeat protein